MTASAAHSGQIRTQGTGSVVTITMCNQRRRNALSHAMFQQLRRILEETALSDATAVVLTGDGDHFCTGLDLSPGAVSDLTPQEGMELVASIAMGLYELPQLVIARVDGDAFGGGLGLVLGADLVVASERARFGATFVNRGLVPDFGTSWLLPRTVGARTTAEMLLLGRSIDAEHALALGLVNDVTSVSELDERIEKWVDQHSHTVPSAVSRTKRLLRAAASNDLAASLEGESDAQLACLADPAFRAAVREFRLRHAGPDQANRSHVPHPTQ
jgi:2-(1,2-epoxy-1,2-dihydrophenyl)acetyl-CoA isomerase